MMNSHQPNSTNQNPNVVYFDLETQKSAKEVGGWSNIDQMKLAVGVTYNTTDREYVTFLEKNVDALISQLKAADLIVGFNLLRFDYVALKPYTSMALWKLPTFDMLVEIHRTLGFRVGLDALAKATLGTAKSADGLQSVRWWKAGRTDLVTEYCRKDVEITKQIFEHACRKEHLLFTDRYGKLTQIDTSRWAANARSAVNHTRRRRLAGGNVG